MLSHAIANALEAKGKHWANLEWNNVLHFLKAAELISRLIGQN